MPNIIKQIVPDGYKNQQTIKMIGQIDGKQSIKIIVRDNERGPQGPKGNTGAQGPQGPVGPTGPQGPAGKDGAIHYTAGTGIKISSDNVISATGGGGGGDAIWGNITGTIDDQLDLQAEFGEYTKTEDLATVATSGSYTDLSNKPSINDATLTITQDGTSLATFTANSNTNATAAIVSPVQIGSTLSSSSSVFVNTANIADGAITTSKLAIGSIIDLFYPVGTYYETSDTSFNPNTSWGGTWVEDSAGLVAVAQDTGTFATVGDTGGEETHTLTVAEMPSHRHNMDRPRWWSSDASIGDSGSIYNQTDKTTALGENIAGQGTRHAIGNTGGDGAHNNLQPYIVVKRWHRTA